MSITSREFTAKEAAFLAMTASLIAGTLALWWFHQHEEPLAVQVAVAICTAVASFLGGMGLYFGLAAKPLVDQKTFIVEAYKA